jgi:RNA polymerase sigma-70 factor (ECF subfamily)
MDSTGGTTRLSFIERLRNRNDTRTWADFHQRYGELLLSYARRTGASRETAEDAVQEASMYLFKALHGFQRYARKGSFRAYLRASVVHALERRNGMKAAQETTLDPRTLDEFARSDPSADAAWQREEYLHRIRLGLRAIAHEFAPVTLEAFRLHALANRSVAEIAEHLGISKESVYQAKSRVLKRLREEVHSLGSSLWT